MGSSNPKMPVASFARRSCSRHWAPQDVAQSSPDQSLRRTYAHGQGWGHDRGDLGTRAGPSPATIASANSERQPRDDAQSSTDSAFEPPEEVCGLQALATLSEPSAVTISVSRGIRSGARKTEPSRDSTVRLFIRDTLQSSLRDVSLCPTHFNAHEGRKAAPRTALTQSHVSKPYQPSVHSRTSQRPAVGHL